MGSLQPEKTRSNNQYRSGKREKSSLDEPYQLHFYDIKKAFTVEKGKITLLMPMRFITRTTPSIGAVLISGGANFGNTLL